MLTRVLLSMLITLLFSSGNDLSAGFIRWFGRGSPFSHVDVVWPDGRLFGARSDKIGGAQAGVQFRDSSYTDGLSVMRLSLSAPEEVRQAFYNFLLDQEGKPYDMTGIFAFVLDRDWQEDDSWFCSELITAALVQCGYFPYPLAAPHNKITPSDLLLLISALTPVTFNPPR